jgi:anti-sigma factor RsiW
MNRAPTDRDLMLYADGELDPGRAREVEAHVAGNPRARAIVAALRQEADLLASAALDSAAAADSIADSVMAAIDSEPARPSLAPVRQLRRSRSVAYAGAFFAAAAAIALATLLPRNRHEEARGPVGPAEAPGFVGAVIDVVDFGARPGTIFYVPSEDESTTAVVWLTEDDASPSSGETL